MRKFSTLLSIAVFAGMILTACGGGATSTAIPTANVPPSTVEVTPTSEVSSETATEAPTEVAATDTPGTSGIPVTGAGNSDRISNELKATVLDQTGAQAGKVDDMVLDLSRAKVLYVVVNVGGKKIPVPWAFLKVNPASATSYPNPSEQQNAFILQADTETLKKAPELNLKNMPQMGESPDSWDISYRKYWSAGGATSSNNTPSAAGTPVTDMTATANTATGGTGTSLATATTSTGTGGTSLATATTTTNSNGAGTSQGNGTLRGALIQGVELASQVLGAKITVGVPILATSTPGASEAGAGSTTSTPSAGGTAVATSTPGASGGTGSATSTPSTTGAGSTTATATSTSGTSTTGTGSATAAPTKGSSAGSLSATIDDLIVNADSGDVLYIVIKASFDDGEHLIPVPLGLLQLKSSGQGSDTAATGSTSQEFILNVDAALLQTAPFFLKDQWPDLTLPDWNSEFESFWQKNGPGQGTGGGSGTNSGTGSGAGVQATATP